MKTQKLIQELKKEIEKKEGYKILKKIIKQKSL